MIKRELYHVNMSDRSSAIGATATARRIRYLKERTLFTNEEIVRRSWKLASPKDIEELYSFDSDFLTFICERVDNANSVERKAYAALGFNLPHAQLMKEDQAIAKSWIDWYKHKRLQEIDSIRALESQFPPRPEFRIESVGHPGFSEWTLIVNAEIPRPELVFRIRQAVQYCRVLYNIFCAPGPAPAPGNPLPSDLPVPDFFVPAPRRFSCRNYVFAGSTTYGQECGKLITSSLLYSKKGPHPSSSLLSPSLTDLKANTVE